MYVMETGMLAKSLAGHDKDKIYLISKIDKDYVFLVDGETRTLQKPKRKKQKHIQIICKKSFTDIERDEYIKRVIKEYNQSVIK